MKKGNKIGKILIFLATICLFCACKTPPEPIVAEPVEIVEAEPEPAIVETKVEIPPPPKPEPLSHTVRWKGETLTYISKWYTGSVKNWKAIAKENPGLDPDRIFPGNEIVIPEELLKNRTPMPKDFLPSTPKAGVPSSPAPRVAAPDIPEPVSAPPSTTEPASSSEPADIELFGPVGLE